MQKISIKKEYNVETLGMTMKVHNYTKNIYQIKNKYTNIQIWMQMKRECRSCKQIIARCAPTAQTNAL